MINYLDANSEFTMYCKAGSTAKLGEPVGFSGNYTVGAQSDGDALQGVCKALNPIGCGVQLKGVVKLPYSETSVETEEVEGAEEAEEAEALVPTLGWCAMVADGDGGVRVAGADETGTLVLVIAVDTTAETVEFIM